MQDPTTAKGTDFESVLASMNLSPENVSLIRAAKKAEEKGRSRRMSEAEIRAKRPHVIEGSLGYDEKANKQFVVIRCTIPGCENTRQTYTSDLHQTKVCDEHKAEAAKAKKAKQRQLFKDFQKAQAAASAAPVEEPEVDETVEVDGE